MPSMKAYGNLEELHLVYDEVFFQKLIQEEILAKYTGFYVTSIVASRESESYNMLTLIEATDEKDFTPQKFQPFSLFEKKEWRYMVTKHGMIVESIGKKISEASRQGEWKEEEKSLKFGRLEFLGSWYVPPAMQVSEGFPTSPISMMLRGKGEEGAHIWEWSDSSGMLYSKLVDNPQLLKEISQRIKNHSNILIDEITDKISNLIIALPVKCLKCEIEGIKGTLDKIRVHPCWLNGTKPRPLQLIAWKERDGMQSIAIENAREDGTFVVANNDNKKQRIALYDVSNRIILYETGTTIMRSITAKFSLCVRGTTICRLFKKEGTIEKIRLPINQKIQTGYTEPLVLDAPLRRRLYQRSLEKLIEKKLFIQYCPTGAEHRDALHKQAIEDIRSLITKYGERKVYLWDPYLSANDVLETLFYNKNSGAQMRALTRLKSSEGTHKSELIRQYHDILDAACIKPFGLNIEFRASANSPNADFHDRFLMFPDFEDEPLVWSLGTSVNSFGREHHIFQQIQHARPIIDAFEGMWDKLQNERNLIWKITSEEVIKKYGEPLIE